MADDVLVTAGAGTAIATDDIGGRHFQRVKLVFGADGVNEGDAASGNPFPITIRSETTAYSLFIPAGAAAANKVWFDLFNAPGSGKVVKIKSLRAIKDGSVAVTGLVTVKLYLTKTTAVGSGGTAAVENGTNLAVPAISEHDSLAAALPAQITARMAPTGGATAGAVICERHVMTEETNAATYDRVEFLLCEGIDVQPLTLREGEGLRVIQGAVASVGSLGFHAVFELE